MEIKNIIKLIYRKYRNYFLYKIQIFNKIYYNLLKIKSIRTWVKNGTSSPPHPYFKRKTVKAYAKKFKLRTLIETGTYRGDMIISNQKNFKKIYSIELDEKIFKKASERCKQYSHISLYQGDSGEILPKILLNIKEPCLFWLDAHYSGEGTAKGLFDSPILKEMEFILNELNLNHVILIDDAREFVGTNGYPTIKELKKLVLTERKDWSFIVKYDIIRIHKNLDYKT